MLLCGYVATWLCGCVAMWTVAMWPCGRKIRGVLLEKITNANKTEAAILMKVTKLCVLRFVLLLALMDPFRSLHKPWMPLTVLEN